MASALKFKLEKRGRIAPGYFADLVLLDLDHYSCKVDFGHPSNTAEGVERVYVNGALAFAADPALKRERNGRMLRIR